MNDSNVADRLRTFIESKGLTYSQFADSCGIPRPSLSQLITGRNKKINDIMVGQIHNMFPELSVLWLLFGEGSMESFPSEKKHNINGADQVNFENELFQYNEKMTSDENKIIFSHKDKEEDQFLQRKSLSDYPNSVQMADYKLEKLQHKIKELQAQINELRNNPRKVANITIYYDDSTFETFYPK